MNLDEIVVSDALAYMRGLPDASVDAVISDPPYGMQLDKWDKPIGIPAFLNEAYRVQKPDSFLAFTMQMPYMTDWLIALRDTDFKYVEHIAWLKRNTGSYAAGLCHAHESILLYRKGSPRFFQTDGRYSDVKVPGLLFDAVSAEGLQRYIDALWSMANGGSQQKSISGGRHLAHIRRGSQNPRSRATEFTNFTNVWSFMPHNLHNRDGAVNHASVKPLKLFERLCTLLTKPGAVILDPYSGSGTTALAARNTGRHWLACDLSPEYVAIALDRLAQPYTPPLFTESPAAASTVNEQPALL